MLSYEEALEIVLASVPAGSSESVELGDCLGRVLAQDVVSPIDLPPFDNSSVDGYAVSGLEQTSFRVLGEIAAGSSVDLRLGPGEACRVFTGSRIPEGTEAVVMQEDGRVEAGIVTLLEPAKAGGFIRRRGEEILAGTSILEAGTLISPPILGLLATVGLSHVQVTRNPSATVIGTGSELVSPGETLGIGQVYESNTYGIRAAFQALGMPNVSIGRVPDDLAATKEILGRALEESEILVVCGGVSVGDHDYVKRALSELGVEEKIWRVKIRPGKPFYFGLARNGQPVFGLPGNPVSALVTFALLVRPAVQKMRDLDPAEAWVQMPAGHAMKGAVGRDDFARARIRAGAAHLEDFQGSHMLSGLASADALVRIPDGRIIQEGFPVDVLRLSWWP